MQILISAFLDKLEDLAILSHILMGQSSGDSCLSSSLSHWLWVYSLGLGPFYSQREGPGSIQLLERGEDEGGDDLRVDIELVLDMLSLRHVLDN